MTPAVKVKKQVKLKEESNVQLEELTAVRKAKHLESTGKVMFSPNKQSVIADLIAAAHAREVGINA